MTTELGAPSPAGAAAEDCEPLVTLQPELSTEAAMKRIHEQLLQRVRDNEAGVREGLDGEYLHDFRVAIRRARTGLGRLADVYPQAARKRLAADLRWLSRTTGPARDLQVYLRSFERFGADLDIRLIEELEPFAAFLRSRRRTEEERCARALASTQYGALLDAWRALLDRSFAGESAPCASLPVWHVGIDSVEAAFVRAAERGAALRIDSAGRAFHRVRLDFKKLRYLLEFFGSLFPEEAWKQAIATLKSTQDTLGAVNDLRVQVEWLQRWPGSETAAAGRLRGYLSNRQASERRSFLACFAELIDDGAEGSLTRLLGIDATAH